VDPPGRGDSLPCKIDLLAYVFDDRHRHSFGSATGFPARNGLHIVWQWQFDRRSRHCPTGS
jgi:hypothetical protein